MSSRYTVMACRLYHIPQAAFEQIPLELTCHSFRTSGWKDGWLGSSSSGSLPAGKEASSGLPFQGGPAPNAIGRVGVRGALPASVGASVVPPAWRPHWVSVALLPPSHGTEGGTLLRA